MTIIREYRMTPRPDRADQLVTALRVLAAQVRSLAGCEEVTLFRSPDGSLAVFAEYWSSEEKYRAGSARLDRTAFTPIMALVAGKPEATHLAPVPLAD